MKIFEYKKSGPNQVNPMVARIVLIVITLFFVIRLLSYQPKIFMWLLIFITLAIGFLKMYKRIAGLVTLKCPRCGQLLENHYQTTEFKGALNADGGEPFSGIVIIHYDCPKCDISYLQLRRLEVKTNYVTGENWRSSFSYQHLHPSADINILNGIEGPREITEEEYKNIVLELKERVKRNNRNAGFNSGINDVTFIK